MLKNKEQIIVWLGSSIGDKKFILDGACNEIKKFWEDFKVSPYIKTHPIWWVAKNTFLNAVCVFYSSEAPLEILDKLQKIEKKFWRVRKERWEDRTLDLDILYFWNKRIDNSRLKIPHPEIQNRDFIKKSILELFPYFDFNKTLEEDIKIMGILNVTPDSFYDWGKYNSLEKAKAHIEKIIEDGADIIDIWGFSSKPWTTIPSIEEELERILPILEFLETKDIEISVDTCRSEILKKILKFKNIKYINDISGYADEKIWKLIAWKGINYILMHIKWTPKNMQNNPKYENIIEELLVFFKKKISILKKQWVEKIILDPGFGFWKTIENNYELLKKLRHFKVFSLPILIWISRKSMMYKFLNSTPKEVLSETSALHMYALQEWINYIRVHDVKEAKNVVKMYKFLKELQ